MVGVLKSHFTGLGSVIAIDADAVLRRVERTGFEIFNRPCFREYGFSCRQILVGEIRGNG